MAVPRGFVASVVGAHMRAKGRERSKPLRSRRGREAPRAVASLHGQIWTRRHASRHGLKPEKVG